MSKNILKPEQIAKLKKLKNAKLQALVGAFLILKNPARWIKGSYATDKKGNGRTGVHSEALNAKCFCTVGALRRADFELYGDNADSSNGAESILDKAVAKFTKGGQDEVINFNDAEGTKHKDVLTLLGDVIRRESRGRIEASAF
ncbi:DUF6197 family protein [Dyella telluris]|uniref:Uncharacterized protein n=1 Tax=Dyella telluris TaxID=2763498 RepID=A0A7G8Q4K6_9GAMM|nr:hypothetical protein [Dyella telluris]QNK01714.1 hypothetical protein H8F01_00595 [Dyella telluris]